MLRVVENTLETKDEEGPMSLDTLAREGARRMLEQALEQEVAANIERHRGATRTVERSWCETARARRGR